MFGSALKAAAKIFSISAFSQNDYLTFYIENNTKTDLYGIYVTGTDSDSWGEDILPDDIFEAGTTLTVTIPINKSTICEQDIQITFSEDDKNPLIFENIDFNILDELNTQVFIKEEDLDNLSNIISIKNTTINNLNLTIKQKEFKIDELDSKIYGISQTMAI